MQTHFCGDLVIALRKLREQGYTIVGAETDAAPSPERWEVPTRKTVIVVRERGPNRVCGCRDQLVQIAHEPVLASLNVKLRRGLFFNTFIGRVANYSSSPFQNGALQL